MEVDQLEKRLLELISAECQINYEYALFTLYVVVGPSGLAKGGDTLATSIITDLAKGGDALATSTTEATRWRKHL